MNIRPRQDCMIVKLDPRREMVGSIIIPDSSTQEHLTGTVTAVGPGTPLPDGTYAPLDIQVGEKVMFLKWNMMHKEGKALINALGEMDDNCILLKARDVLLVYPADEPHIFG